MNFRLLLKTVPGLILCSQGLAFPGLLLNKSEGKLSNQMTRVVIAHDEERTVLTIQPDYKGDPKEFSMLIPIPSNIESDQIHISNSSAIDRIDTFTSPRLSSQTDPSPCAVSTATKTESQKPQKSLSATVEADALQSGFDITILNSKDNSAIVTWLKDNKFSVNAATEKLLNSYVQQNFKFVFAKLNLLEANKNKFALLPPIQIAFNSPRFVVPIRLGTLNSKTPQEMLIFTLSKRGRIESSNYHVVKAPTEQSLPLFTSIDFPKVYSSIFAEQTKREEMRSLILEFAWDIGWCEYCTSDPLTKSELQSLGVFWLDEPVDPNRPVWPGSANYLNAFVTRLHLKYSADKFTEDLKLQETLNRENFQTRFSILNPFVGEMNCTGVDAYKMNVRNRQDSEAKNLASLTNMSIEDIRTKMNLPGDDPGVKEEDKWWKKLWKNEVK